MFSSFIFQSAINFFGLLLAQASILAITYDKFPDFGFKMLLLGLLAINGFAFQLGSIYISRKFSKMKSNLINMILILFGIVFKSSFLSIIAYLVIIIENEKDSFMLSMLYMNYLFLGDYFEHKNIANLKLQNLFIYRNRVSLFIAALEGCGLLAASIFDVVYSTLRSNNFYFYFCILIVFLFYSNILRLIFIFNQINSNSSLEKSTDNNSRDERIINTQHEFGEEYQLINETYQPNRTTKFQAQNNNIEPKDIVNNEIPLIIYSKSDQLKKPDQFFNAVQPQQINHSLSHCTNNSNLNNCIRNIIPLAYTKPPTKLMSSCTIKTSDKIQALWEYLPTLFKDGCAIFEKDKIINSNCAFSKFISTILGQSISQDCLNLNWKQFFSKISMTDQELKSVTSFAEEEYSLQDIILQFIDIQLEDPFQEIKYKYNIQKDNNVYQVSIFKKFINEDSNFTILKIDDISSEYSTISRAASLKIKKKFRMSLAHEAQTPLNYLITSIKSLKKEIPQQSYHLLNRSTKLFQLALHGIFRIAFVENFNHIECIPQRILISGVIQKVLKNLKPLFKSRDVALVFENHSTQVEDLIYHDKIIIETIIYQFLANSLKFTKSGKVIVQLFWNEDDDDFKVSFTDTGIGMNEEEKNNLTLFLTSDVNDILKISEYSTGSNMGMSICKSLMCRIHKTGDQANRILFESQKNVGTTFTITISKSCSSMEDNFEKNMNLQNPNKMRPYTSIDELEIVDQKQNEGLDLASIGSEGKLPGFCSMLEKIQTYKFMDELKLQKVPEISRCSCPFRILVVDDEEFNVMSFQTIYLGLVKKTTEKQEILAERNGKDGLNTFMNYFKHKRCNSPACCPIKVVVLDYNMPGLMGPDIAADIYNYLLNESKLNLVHVYGWTAYIGEKYQKDFMNAGAIGILSKPIKVKELLQVLSNFLKF